MSNSNCWILLTVGAFLCAQSDAAACKGRNFVLSSSKVNQATAKSACNSGGNLASISDQTTQNHLSTLASSKVGNGWTATSEVYAFIGGERTGNDFKWPDGTTFSTLSGSTWSTTGYNGWASGSGPSGSGTCMVFTGTRSGSFGSYTYTWKWGNAACTGIFYSICENMVDRSFSVTTTTTTPTLGSTLTFTGTISRFSSEPLNVDVDHNSIRTPVVTNFVGNSFIYRIEDVALSHTGEFKFTAENDVRTCSIETTAQITVGSAALSFNPSSTVRILNVNSVTTVTCTCSGYYQPQCRWYRNNAEVSFSSSTVYQVSSTTSGGSTGNSVLHVRINNEPGNGGWYFCKTINWSGSGTTSKSLVIRVTATIEISTPEINLAHGSTQQVNCQSKGNPIPMVDWMRSGASLSATTTNNVYQSTYSSGYYVRQELHFRIASVLDGGSYVCKVAGNADGGELTRTLTVTVQPNITLSTSTTITANYGESRTVACTSYGYPTPNAYWKRHNGATLSFNSNDPYYQTNLTEAANYKSTATLHIPKASVDVAGRYDCTSQNSGAVNSTVLQVLIRANISLSPSSPWKTPVFPASFSVDCLSYGWRAPTVTWSINAQAVSTSTTSQVHEITTSTTHNQQIGRLQFNAASIEQVGVYKCTASNNNDNAHAVQATFQVQAKANISLSSTTISLKDGQKQQINCTSYGFPTPEVYWKKNSQNVSLGSGADVHQVVLHATTFKTVSMLIFEKPSLAVTGTYICHSRNSVGDNQVTSLSKSLTVDVGPTFFNASSPALEFSQSQSLNCTFAADQSTTFHWSINDQLVTSDKSPTYVTNFRTGNSVTSQLSVMGAAIFGAKASVRCWAANNAGKSQKHQFTINKDLAFRGGQYYIKHNSALSSALASKYCADHGGEVPTTDYVTNYFPASQIAVIANGVWTQGSTELMCVKANGSTLYTSTCNGSHFFFCTFPVVKIVEVSNCLPNSIAITWKDKTEIQRNISYLITATNTNTGANYSKQSTHVYSPTNYITSVGNLVSDGNYRLTLELFPAISKLPEPSRVNGSTSSVFQSVVGNMALQGDQCAITITIPGSIVPSVTSLMILVSKSTIDGTGNVTEIPQTPAATVEHKVKVNEGESLKVKFKPVTAKCKATDLAVSGSCERGTTTANAPPTNSGATVGGAVASVLIILLLVGLIFFQRANIRSYMVKRKRKTKHLPTNARNIGFPSEDSAFSFEEENPYGDVDVVKAPDDDTTRVDVADLEEAFIGSVQSRHANLNQQFAVIKTSAVGISSINVATKPANAKRNRYKNIIPYDNNYVALEDSPNPYINASFVKGYQSPKKWIATQGPTQNTVDDFWMMVWQQNTGVIVMLANLFEKGKSKCIQYWPDEGKTQRFGEFGVKTEKVINKGFYVIRRMSVEQSSNEYANELRTITQFHFTAWPDHGVPATTSGLLRLYNDVSKMMQSLDSIQPTVLHCSAGAGRTGTFIGLDYLLEEMKTRSSIDVYQAVMHMREQRMEMVQTVLQYVFLHKLLYEIHVLGNSDSDAEGLIWKHKEMQGVPTNNAISTEFERLRAISDLPISPIMINDRHLAKYVPKSGEFSAYSVETYERVDGIIVSTQPGKEAMDTFWEITLEKNVEIIVGLTSTSKKAQYWPSALNTPVEYGDISVTKLSESLAKPVTQRNFAVKNNLSGLQTNVTHLEFDNWSELDLPNDDLFDLFAMVDSHLNDNKLKNMLVLANNDFTRPAMFCICWNLVARYNAEMMVDVYRAFKDTQDCLPGVTLDKNHYECCYTMMLSYINSFSSYANFTNSPNVMNTKV